METPREGRWFAAPKPVEWTHDVRAIRRQAFQCLGGVPILLAVAGAGSHLSPWLGIGVCGGIGAVFARLSNTVLSARRQRRLRPEDFSFRDREFGLGEHPVEIVVVVGSVCLGVDRGIVAFEEGLLSFHGTATSFALAAADFRLRGKFDLRDPYLCLPLDSLLLRTEGPSAFIRLVALGESRLDLKRDLDRFFHRSLIVSGPRQWPPLESYRSLNVDTPLSRFRRRFMVQEEKAGPESRDSR